MTPAEHGAALARTAPPLTAEQIATAARILGGAKTDQVQREEAA